MCLRRHKVVIFIITDTTDTFYHHCFVICISACSHWDILAMTMYFAKKNHYASVMCAENRGSLTNAHIKTTCDACACVACVLMCK